MIETNECWSVDEETFCYESLQDLLDSNDHLVAGNIVYVGRPEHPKAEQLCDASDIIDMIADRVCDIGGEYAEGYPDASKEAIEELDAFIKSWITKHCPPNFYTVEDVREYEITDKDMK